MSVCHGRDVLLGHCKHPNSSSLNAGSGKDVMKSGCLGHLYHTLNSLKGGYIGDYIGDYYRGY